jgi:predicted metal-dependent hydrolase
MNTKKIKIGDIEIITLRKNIKNLHLGVYPPNGRVRIAAPLKTSDESIRLFAISKISWIKKQKAKFDKQSRQAKREYVSGESHYFFGKRYLLNVVHINPSSRIELRKKKHIDLYIKPNSSHKRKEKIVEDWYRSELKKILPPLIKKWEKVVGIKVKDSMDSFMSNWRRLKVELNKHPLSYSHWDY